MAATILNNALFDTLRAQYSAVTQSTSKALPYLQGLVGNMRQSEQTDYMYLPEGALLTSFVIRMDEAYDVVQYDLLTNVRQFATGLPWIGIGANEVWVVHFVHHLPMQILGHKEVYIMRATGGGKPS